jgi:hypothetical protein
VAYKTVFGGDTVLPWEWHTGLRSALGVLPLAAVYSGLQVLVPGYMRYTVTNRCLLWAGTGARQRAGAGSRAAAADGVPVDSG